MLTDGQTVTLRNAPTRCLRAWDSLEDVGGEIDPDNKIPFLRFALEAQGLFVEWRGELEARLRTGGLPEALESHLAKYRSLIPSLALLIHLVDVGGGPVGLLSLTARLRLERSPGIACQASVLARHHVRHSRGEGNVDNPISATNPREIHIPPPGN